MSSVEKSQTPVESIQSAWTILAKGAPTAARALLHIAEYGESEAARNQASMAILDRVGISARPEMTVRVVPAEYSDHGQIDGSLSPAEMVFKRLAELRAATEEEQARKLQEESEIVDAVIVE